jgi:hypothetical protein
MVNMAGMFTQKAHIQIHKKISPELSGLYDDGGGGNWTIKGLLES